MTYWPGTGIMKSEANDFTMHTRMAHSCMWSSGEEARAKKLNELAEQLSAEERAKEVTAYTPLSLIGYSKPRRSRK